MHNPIESLRSCYRLLKPGGKIWIETPNIKSLGYSRFQENWRGLEPPRHLVLFNSESLCNALLDIGFYEINYNSQASPCHGIYTVSQRIKDGIDPRIDSPITLKLRFEIAVAKLIELIFKSRKEFIAITAIKKIK